MGSVQPAYFQEPRALFQDLAAIREDKSTIPYSSKLEAYVVTRYDDIVAVLDHPEILSSKPTVPEPPAFVKERIGSKCPMRGTLLGHDNPDHDRLRQSANSFFVPRKLQRFEPLIEKLAHELIDEFAADGRANLKTAFALPMPLKVVSAIVGLHPADWKWVARSLSLFGGHAELALETFEEKLDGIVEIHEHVARLIQQRRVDRRDDLISHIWNEREAGTVVMTDFEHLSMIPGLLLAGHETTTNLLSMGMSHLLHGDLWDSVSESDTTRTAAIEELLRYESAITGMKREVLQPFRLGQHEFQPGDHLFVAYNAGSRDPEFFEEPDRLDPGRRSSKQHFGFGRGIHACLGAPLARLLLRVEMRVLRKRLPSLRLATDYNKIHYDHVHEGRGVGEVLVAWDGEKARQLTILRKALSPASEKEEEPQRLDRQNESVALRVTDVASVAENVALLTVAARTQGTTLPRWAAGAHLDVPVGNEGWRQYSLCSDPAVGGSWQIAVLREDDGSGGSRYVHAHIRPGTTLTAGGPRNHFELRPAKRYLFIAGGIGITPIRAMRFAARSQHREYEMVYLGSTRERMAFVDELEGDPNVRIWPKHDLGPFQLESLRDRAADQGLQIYCCGPERLIKGVESAFAHLPPGSVNVERFQNTVDPLTEATSTPFEVVLRKSGRKFTVPASRTLLDVLQDNQVSITSTCTKGTCGTCEVPVVSGQPDHRDTVLSRTEKLENRSMMVCVSRCRGEQLVLDLW